MRHSSTSQPGLKTLQVLLAPIVRWSVRLGLGYGPFSRMLKPLFFQAAQEELSRQGVRHSDSALSFLSGLHKGDIAAFLSGGRQAPLSEDDATHRINPANQVVARWVIEGLPRVLPIKGEGSFDALVRDTQSERGTVWSTRLILQDLERRKLVADDGRQVRLLSEVGLPDVDSEEGIVHFVGATSDHMQACLSNLDSDTPRLLEQSLMADGLFVDSVHTVHEMARQWWSDAVRDIGAKAIECSNQDEPKGGNRRLRLGVYFYTEKVQPHPAVEPVDEID